MNAKFSFTKYKLRRNNKGETGFTLLEVLLAVSLTGILLLLTFPALSNLSRYLTRAYDTTTSSRVQRLLYRKLAETLENAYWYPYYDDRLGRFTGDERGFTVPVVEDIGLVLAEFQWNGSELTFKRSQFRRHNAGPEEEINPETVVLTDQLVNPAFSYLDGNSGVWRSVWREEYYPRLVRFTSAFRFRNGQETTLVPLVFTVRAGQDVGR